MSSLTKVIGNLVDKLLFKPPNVSGIENTFYQYFFSFASNRIKESVKKLERGKANGTNIFSKVEETLIIYFLFYNKDVVKEIEEILESFKKIGDRIYIIPLEALLKALRINGFFKIPDVVFAYNIASDPFEYHLVAADIKNGNHFCKKQISGENLLKIIEEVGNKSSLTTILQSCQIKVNQQLLTGTLVYKRKNEKGEIQFFPRKVGIGIKIRVPYSKEGSNTFHTKDSITESIKLFSALPREIFVLDISSAFYSFFGKLIKESCLETPIKGLLSKEEKALKKIGIDKERNLYSLFYTIVEFGSL